MAPPPLDAKLEGELKAAFYAFASFGSGTKLVEMDGKGLIKLVKDCKLMSKALTATDVDLIFAKVKTKGERKIPFDQFVSAIDAFAAKKGCAYEDVVRAVVTAGGPIDGGTKAEAVKWHDDKSLYTGVYGKGGPTNVDMDPSSLASVCDRTAADARGVKVSPASRRGTADLIGASPAAAGRSTGESLSKVKL
ncbi:MAG: p25-alpha-domain-containing protein [Monoraphidium minutum]|nr:MAG: p25-alpha-domain-containing protein [Monoraphidium minutum]